MTREPVDDAPTLEGYELLRELGAGGMGTVYEARQRSNDRRVAVKILAEEHCKDPSSVERFRREAKAADEIEHENIVEILDAGMSEQGAPFFVMELLAGRNLAELLRDEGPLPWSRVRLLALQAAAALDAAHQKGIVHRDVKPANCIVCPLEGGGERLKVCDFGIAKQFGSGAEQQDSLTRPGTIVGSTRYMAPEQFTTGKATRFSDIYALGIVLHELLVGVPPFKSKNPMEVVAMHVRDEPPRVSSLRSGLPEVVSDFILTCLAKQPEQRFASMSELREALRSLPLVGLDEDRAGAGFAIGQRVRSIPPTEVLDENDARASAGLVEAAHPALGRDPDAPVPLASRPPTRGFEAPLEAERETSWIWIVVGVVLVAAALALVWMS